MICNACGNSNPSNNNFCIHCGTALKPASPHVEADVIAAEVSNLRLELNALKESLQAHGIELVEPEQPGFAAAEAPGARPPIPTEDVEPVEVQSAAFSTSAADESTRFTADDSPGPEISDTPFELDHGGAAAAYATPPRDPWFGLRDRFDDFDWDAVIGGNWLVRIGALAVVLGMGFFLKLAIDTGLLTETGRVVLGLAGGIAMLGAGQYWREKYPVYSHALAGGGIAILYLSIFTAFALYDLIDIYPAIGLLLLVSITSAVLAVAHNSVVLALMGIFGGFGAPFLLGGSGEGTGSSAPTTAEAVGLLIYIAAINVGVIVLSTFRKWHWFVLLALLGSLGAFGVWTAAYMGPDGIETVIGSDSAALVAQAGITSIFLSFVAATTLFHLVWRRRPNALDLSLMFFNALAFAGISFGIMWVEFREWMGPFALLMALFYGGVGYVAVARVGIAPIDRENLDYDSLLTYISLGIGTVFLTIAIPIQIGGPWISVAWMFEAMVILWIGVESRLPDVRRASIALFAMALGTVLFIDTPRAFEDAPGLFQNSFAISYPFVIAGAFGTAVMAARWKERTDRIGKYMVPVAVITGFVLLAVAIPTQIPTPWATVAWMIEAVVILGVGMKIRLLEVRIAAVVMWVFTIGAVAFWVTPDAISDAPGEFRNIFTVAYALVAAGAFGTAYIAARWKGLMPEFEEHEVRLMPAAIIAGFGIIALAIPTQMDAPWVAPIWVFEAIVILWVGMKMRMPEVRISAIVMYGFTLGATLLVDTPRAFDDAPGLFANRYAISYAIVAAASFGIAYIIAPWAGKMSELKNAPVQMAPVLVMAGFGILALAVPTQVEGPWMVLWWAILGIVATGVGARVQMLEMRLTGLALLVIATLAALFEESIVPSRGYTVLLNSRFLAFGPLIAAVAASSLLWHRWPQPKFEVNGRYVVMALIAAANGLTLWFLSAEVIGGVQSGAVITVAAADRFDVTSLGLTILWAGYGALGLVVGFIGGWRPVRLAGLVLIAIPVVKLFLFDSFQLDQGFRVASFMVMGIILLSGGYLYQRHNAAFKDFFLDVKGQTADAQ